MFQEISRQGLTCSLNDAFKAIKLKLTIGSEDSEEIQAIFYLLSVSLFMSIKHTPTFREVK